jgi:hypothetical protein
MNEHVFTFVSQPGWQGFRKPHMPGFTDPHDGEIITTLFVMVRVWFGVIQREVIDEACVAP